MGWPGDGVASVGRMEKYIGESGELTTSTRKYTWIFCKMATLGVTL
jgi:hypothetical protein